MAGPSSVQVNDGVAVIVHGDVVLIVYQAPARLHRSRWLFDLLDEAAARANPYGIKGFMVVLSTADPPDAATRAENVTRLRRLGSGLRLLVTVPIGDVFWISVVRTLMRAMHLIPGTSRRHMVATTLEAGLDSLYEAAGPSTPPRTEVEADLDALHAALGVKAPWAPNKRATLQRAG